MSGICSAHKEFVAGCYQCEVSTPQDERPPIEDWIYNERALCAEDTTKIVRLGLYALALEREKAELEARLRRAEEALAMAGERAVARQEALKGMKGGKCNVDT